MTAQEIFDKVWHHMSTQKVQSLSKTGNCAYRGDNGMACAVGCLLDDETAHNFDDMDNASIEWIDQHHKNIIPEELRSHVELMYKLQLAHDINSTVNPWTLEIFQERARKIANKFGLTVPEVVQ